MSVGVDGVSVVVDEGAEVEGSLVLELIVESVDVGIQNQSDPVSTHLSLGCHTYCTR